MDAKLTQPRVAEGRGSPQHDPTSPNAHGRGRLDSRASYADYLRSVQEVLASEDGGATPATAGHARPSPPLGSGASPSIRGRKSLGLLVSPSPLLTQHKESPVHAVTASFKPTAEELEEFQLEPAASEECCRCCGSTDVWVDVTCFADGSKECCCAGSAQWGLCEACCEFLVHDECLQSQVPKVKRERGITPPKEEPSVLPAGGEAFYEGLLEVQDDTWQPQPNPYANPYGYQEQSWYGQGWGYQQAQMGQMGMGWGYCPSVVDLQNMGADLSQICVEFAANGRCPRGNTCRWIHCKV